jgi:hypothetical protein
MWGTQGLYALYCQISERSDNRKGCEGMKINRLLVASVAVSTAVVKLMSNAKKIVPRRRRKAVSEEE